MHRARRSQARFASTAKRRPAGLTRQNRGGFIASMGNSVKREAVTEFIETGELPAIPKGGGLDDMPDAPLDAAWLADILDRRRRLQTNPVYELQRYIDFFKKPDLTEVEVDRLLETMAVAVARPEDFYDSVAQSKSILGTLREGMSIAAKIPMYFPTREVTAAQKEQLATLRQRYKILEGVDVNPNDHHFEVCDPRWWPLLNEKVEEVMQRWPKGLAAFRSHTTHASQFVYQATKQTKKLALFADFGVGQYQTECIARQLAAKAYPYVFHLGDVYYGGTQAEFDKNFTKQLEQVLKAGSTFFGLAENHELYGEGKAYFAFLDRERDVTKRMIQEGSYFCVKFPKHQIIGADVNWNGRQRFQHKPSRQWLAERLREGTEQKLTTILLTGSAPFVYGETGTTKLYDHFLEWSEQGHFALWFWADDHYCALFERTDRANFVGSCIGHGGYPGDLRSDKEKSFVKPTWVETEPRFPRGAEFSKLRHDLVNNGWCELELFDDGGIDITYVDWLGAKRFWASYRWEQALIPRFRLVDQKVFDRSTLH